MQITQMHSQLTELSSEYERIGKVGLQLRSVYQQIESSIAHLTSLKFNVERQIEAFAKIAPLAPLKEDTI
jgi:hypothetical protein